MQMYGKFMDKYVDKMWLDPSNWKIAYDVWMTKGKECNKFSIQIYHLILKTVIPYLQREFDAGRRVKCGDLIMYTRNTNYEWGPIAYDIKYRADEFTVAVTYDTQKYK